METIALIEGSKNLGDRIIKVNHAGERGAICIYSGQILMARVTARSLVNELLEFRSHEQRHLAIFGAELKRRGRPRCRSYWLCGIGGYLLGICTGLFGRAAIAATTVAVESVVIRHLKHQLVVLGNTDPEAVSAISAIVSEEQQHHDNSAAHIQSGAFWPRVEIPAHEKPAFRSM
jgi:3-demethoxyubiquinol 3-hydroxylase